jgi:hypothetical protein
MYGPTDSIKVKAQIATSTTFSVIFSILVSILSSLASSTLFSEAASLFAATLAKLSVGRTFGANVTLGGLG